MNTLGTVLSPRATAHRIPRFLAVLSLALALLAIPAFSPSDAGAYPMSEGNARGQCRYYGGRISYHFHDSDFANYTMTCSTASGLPIMSCYGWYDSLSCWWY